MLVKRIHLNSSVFQGPGLYLGVFSSKTDAHPSDPVRASRCSTQSTPAGGERVRGSPAERTEKEGPTLEGSQSTLEGSDPGVAETLRRAPLMFVLPASPSFLAWKSEGRDAFHAEAHVFR